MTKTTILLAVALAAGSASAQITSDTDPIATIRPRVTDTTRLVPVGRFQLEAGFNVGYDGIDIARQKDYGLAVLRYGASRRVELRIEAPTYSEYRVSFFDGLGNTSVDAIVLLGHAGPVWFAAQPRLTIPTAVDPRRADEVAPSLFFTGEAEFSNYWIVASTVGGLHEKLNGVTYDVMRATLCVERYIDSRSSGFVEYVGTYIRDAEPAHVANLGARLRLSHRLQVDAHWTLPLSNSLTPRTIGAGVSYRF